MLETYGTLTLTFACLIAIYLCYKTVDFLQQLASRRSFSQHQGCKSPKAHHPCGFLGLGLLGEIGKQFAEGRRLKSLKAFYDEYGTTYLTDVFGQTTVNTIAPENLHMIYASNFDDYGAEPARLPSWDTHRRGWEFLPFSGGARVCPAQQLALTETSFVMFSLTWKFKEIRSRDEKPWTERIRLTAANKNGVHVSLIPE